MILPALVMLTTPLRPGNHSLRVEGLQTEHLKNPRGIDRVRPLLSWFGTSSERSDESTAYRVLVAQSKADLARNKGTLWDSGKIPSKDISAEYQGKPLTSGMECYWKVRAWDKQGKPSPWSQPHFWSMGLLRRADWKAKWITSPILAEPENRPRTPIYCYRSELSSDPNLRKWITVDLGAVQAMDSVVLAEARPEGLTFDIGSVQFPRRFRIEASSTPTFDDPILLVDQTASDFPDPRNNGISFSFPTIQARYVRLDVMKLGTWDARDFGIFLGQFSIFAEEKNLSIGAKVTASDSIENDLWSTRFLVTGHSQVEFGPFPPAIDPKVDGAFSSSRTPLLRREFSIEGPIQRATLYSTARGFYEARLNGHKVSEDLLAPGFTDYHQRMSYETYDVTKLLKQGPNAMSALLGYGWYAGHMNLGGNGYFYGYFPQFAAQLEIEFKDGRRQTVCTDQHWRTTLDGPVRWSDLLDGEATDFRLEQKGWDRPGFADANWQPAWSQDLGIEKLVTQKTPPVKVIREMKPLKRTQIKPGTWVYDLGQEITGWVRVKVDGPAGTHIVIRHAEAIKPDGELDVASLWGTLQRDDYILDGHGARSLEPHFTYHGFRYFEISGLPSDPTDGDITAINIHTDVEEIGQFECSNPLFNRLMEASKWTQRNLFFDVPAGCAARSERLAWTGDIRPCVQTALFNFDTAAFFSKYATDLRDDQKSDGRFTDISPHAHLTGTDICVGSPGWADAGVSLPWEVYVNTGDKRLLAEHFEAAKSWVDFIHRHNPDLIWRHERGMDWGDWLSAGKATPKELGATAFFAHSTDLVARMAKVLGQRRDERVYGALFERIKAEFAARYVSSDGVIRETPAYRPLDVTQVVKRTAKFVVGNEALGSDPAPGVLKKLVVRVRDEGSGKTLEFTEGSQVDLPPSLQIESASYEVSTKPADDDVQGSYALALRFGLLDEPLRSQAVGRLIQVIARDGGHPTTGFWSSIELVTALSDAGHHATASKMVNLQTAPSWGHMLAAGGTTFWEAFDADQKTLSLNHWTHSACGEWLWRNVAGLSPDPNFPGYQHFTIHPRPSPEVSWCKASYRSTRGLISVKWKLDGNQFLLELLVPPGSSATVYLPKLGGLITESNQEIDQAKGVRFVKRDGDALVYKVNSGTYRFTSK